MVAVNNSAGLNTQLVICTGLFQAQQFEKALIVADNLLEQYPNEGRVWKLKGSALYMLQRDSVSAMRFAAKFLPEDAEVHNSLGAALQEAGQTDQAVMCYRRAVDLDPDFSEAHLNLGAALRARDKLKEALNVYREAVRLHPNFIEAYSDMALTLRGLGRPEEAALACRRALAIDSHFLPALANLGTLLLDLKQLDEAEEVCRHAIQVDPDLSALHNNLGTVLQARGDMDGAAASFRQAIDIDPGDADASSNWGALLLEQDKLTESAACCQRAIDINPGHAAAYNNLGTAFKTQGKLDLALKSYLQALKLRSHYVEAHRNAGLVLYDMGQPEAGEAHLAQALAIEPDCAATHCAWALTLLRNGDLVRGWKEYEFRWTGSIPPLEKPALPLPVWHGESLVGKTLFVWGEQGIGDQILFASMLPDVARWSAHCLVACSGKLLPLFSNSFPNIEFMPLSDLASDLRWRGADYQCSMGSLAQWLRPTIESFRTQGVLLKPERQRLDKWQMRFKQLGSRPKIGICWQSANLKGERQLEFSALDQWGAILSTPDIDFVNLQIGARASELEQVATRFGARIHCFPDLDLRDDLEETAAMVSALDLVIGNTTATGRLAAALGVQTWALRYGPGDWTNLGTDHNPWLPSFRYFTKKWNQNWEGVIDHVAQTLAAEWNTVKAPI